MGENSCCCSVSKSYPTLCNLMDWSMPGSSVSRSLFQFIPLSWWCYLTILSFATPMSFCLQSSPASESFPMSRLLASGSQSIGASAQPSVLSVIIKGWFLLGLTGLISLQSKGLSSLLQHHNLEVSVLWHSIFFYGPTLISIHDYRKNYRFDYVDFCWQNDASAF